MSQSLHRLSTHETLRNLLIDYGDWECLIDTGYQNAWPTNGENWKLLSAAVCTPIEAFVLSHADQDHYSAFVLLASAFRIERVFHGPDEASEAVIDSALLQLATENPQRQIPSEMVRAVSANPSEKLADMKLDWRVLHPSTAFAEQEEEKNENSLVLLLTFGSVGFLFVGDAEHAAEDELQRTSDFDGTLVLKVSHHGSRSSTSVEFVRWADPELAIISGDAEDLDSDTAETLGLCGVPFLQTCRNGTICVSTDGTAVWVEIGRVPQQGIGCPSE